jgi:hypothetical protein
MEDDMDAKSFKHNAHDLLSEMSEALSLEQIKFIAKEWMMEHVFDCLTLLMQFLQNTTETELCALARASTSGEINLGQLMRGYCELVWKPQHRQHCRHSIVFLSAKGPAKCYRNHAFLTEEACYEFMACDTLIRQMSSRAQILTYSVDQDYPILQHALQRPVKVGKHDGLGSGLNVKPLRVPDDVNWNEIHTWSAPDPFLDGIADSEDTRRRFIKETPHTGAYQLQSGSLLLQQQLQPQIKQ